MREGNIAASDDIVMDAGEGSAASVVEVPRASVGSVTIEGGGDAAPLGDDVRREHNTCRQ